MTSSENDPMSEEEEHNEAYLNYKRKNGKVPNLTIDIASDLPQDSPVKDKVKQMSLLSPNFSSNSGENLRIPFNKELDEHSQNESMQSDVAAECQENLYETSSNINIPNLWEFGHGKSPNYDGSFTFRQF